MIDLSFNEKRIIDLFVKVVKPMNTTEVCRELDMRYNYANQLLWQLEIRGLLIKTKRLKSNKGFVYYHLNEENVEINKLLKQGE